MARLGLFHLPISLPSGRPISFLKGVYSKSNFLLFILVSPGTKVMDAAIRDPDEPMDSDHFPETARVGFP